MRNPSFNQTVQRASISVALAVIAGLASAQTGNTVTNAVKSAASAASSAVGTAASSVKGAMHSDLKVASADAAFMKQAAQNGNTEVEASKLALTKASSADVKTFAQQMIDDHTKAGDELKTLATSKGVEVSDKPSVAQAAKIKALGAMSGANFDKSYARIVGVNAHQDTVKLFQKESANGRDAEVKAFATKTLPTLQHHLEMSQALKASTSGKSVS